MFAELFRSNKKGLDQYSNNMYSSKAKDYGIGGVAEQSLLARAAKSKQDASSYFQRTMASTVDQNRSERLKRFAGQGIRSNSLLNEGMKADQSRLAEQGYDAYSKFSIDTDQNTNQGLLGLYGIGSQYDKMGLDYSVNQQQTDYENDNAFANGLGGILDMAVGFGAGRLGQSFAAQDSRELSDYNFEKYKKLLDYQSGMTPWRPPIERNIPGSSSYDPFNIG